MRDLSPAVLSAFVTARSARWGMSMLGGLCAVLRVFLRYLHRERLIPQDLSPSIDGPRQYPLSTLPRSISWAEVERMLAAVDRRHAVGKRDYAILLLLVTYGLRGREVAALSVDDIDWERERLRVPERKAGHATAYPLSPIVGEAILDYLRNGRPQRPDRRVFYRVLAPWEPLTPDGVSDRAIGGQDPLQSAGCADDGCEDSVHLPLALCDVYHPLRSMIGELSPGVQSGAR